MGLLLLLLLLLMEAREMLWRGEPGAPRKGGSIRAAGDRQSLRASQARVAAEARGREAGAGYGRGRGRHRRRAGERGRPWDLAKLRRRDCRAEWARHAARREPGRERG